MRVKGVLDNMKKRRRERNKGESGVEEEGWAAGGVKEKDRG